MNPRSDAMRLVLKRYTLLADQWAVRADSRHAPLAAWGSSAPLRASRGELFFPDAGIPAASAISPSRPSRRAAPPQPPSPPLPRRGQADADVGADSDQGVAWLLLLMRQLPGPWLGQSGLRGPGKLPPARESAGVGSDDRRSVSLSMSGPGEASGRPSGPPVCRAASRCRISLRSPGGRSLHDLVRVVHCDPGCDDGRGQLTLTRPGSGFLSWVPGLVNDQGRSPRSAWYGDKSSRGGPRGSGRAP